MPSASEPLTTESPKHATLTGAACALCAAARHAKRIERRFIMVSDFATRERRTSRARAECPLYRAFAG